MNTPSLLSVIASVVVLSACGGGTEAENTTPTADTTAAVVDTMPAAIEVLAIVIGEHAINDVSMVRAHHEARRKGAAVDTTAHTKPYETATSADLAEAFAAAEVVPADTMPAEAPAGLPVSVSISGVNVVDKAMLVAYEKKGVELMQVTVDESDPEQVMHVVFMSKDHVDVYDVRPGMKGADARRMRRELKHMVHKGRVFLYDESSNITYRMAVSDGAKEVYSEQEVDTMEVEAIVWSNKHQRRARKGKA
jgi:hypothetical protein